MNRERLIKWEDPMTGAAGARNMSGLDYLLAMQRNELPLPPALYTMDFHVDNVTEGQVSFSFLPQEFHYNPIGSVHGGVITSILDSAMGCTIHSTLPAGKGYTTLELKVNFLKAVTTKSGKLTATAKIIRAGNTTALVEAQLTDDSGNIYAHALSTCLIMTF